MQSAITPYAGYGALKEYARLHSLPENADVLVLDPVLRNSSKF